MEGVKNKKERKGKERKRKKETGGKEKQKKAKGYHPC